MRVSYDEKDDVPHMTTGQRAATCAGLLSATDDVALELATSDGHDVIGIIAVGASGYFSPWKGYDAERDILTIGKTTDDPDLITENGDFVGYWQTDEEEPDGFRHPVGVAIRRASVHLAKVLDALPQPLDIGNG